MTTLKPGDEAYNKYGERIEIIGYGYSNDGVGGDEQGFMISQADWYSGPQLRHFGYALSKEDLVKSLVQEIKESEKILQHVIRERERLTKRHQDLLSRYRKSLR